MSDDPVLIGATFEDIVAHLKPPADEKPSDEKPKRRERWFRDLWVEALEGATIGRRDMNVALALFTFMKPTGSCYPAIKTIARRAKLSSATVSRGIAVLVEEGWLVRQGGRPTKYQAVIA